MNVKKGERWNSDQKRSKDGINLSRIKLGKHRT